ncbi:MAG: TauD/TfdA dioxygenase family protein [Sphingomonadaceae bacterium]
MTRQLASSAFFEVDLLDDRFDWGVSVSGLSMSALSDPEVRQQLYDLWIQEGVIVFHGIDGLQEQLALSRIFGPLREHPSPDAISATTRELIDVQFEPVKGQLCTWRGELRGQSLPWHSDLIYVDKINHGGILRPIKLPSHLGQTGFVDKISAYSELPEDVKARIEGLHVIYQYDMEYANIRFGPDRGEKIVRWGEMASKVQSRIHQYPRSIHPLVFTQPETGRKVLNLSPWFAQGIQEMPNTEGDELLEFLAQHIASDERAYYHPWKMGEMLLWDNWRMLHAAVGAPVDEERYLQRTTIGGDYGLGTKELSTGAHQEALEYLHM